MGVSHVMEPARVGDGGAHSGFPESAAEAGATQRPTCRCGEDQAVVAGVGGDVLGEDVDEMRSTLALARPEAVQQVETVDNM